MPFLTDLNKQKPVIAVVIALIGLVVWKGGETGRITVGILIATVIISDQLNSSFLKEIFGRVRPCRALDGVRLLVDCGGGLSFPSSHAVNNFAGAFVIAHFYKNQKWYWYSFAFLVALSRPYVGVHYPSDILAGGVVGIGIGFITTYSWEYLSVKVKKRNSIHLDN
ncbi:MAG: phosphatase PAP2 family protein [Ignavibacteriales bacterium]|nr:phosphatase PAP2 family protein [Ignavibacteriales bacterium]